MWLPVVEIGVRGGFVASVDMQRLAESGVNPEVVDDQIGRLTYTPDLAAGIANLLATNAPFGTYNVTSGGEPKSWFQIARDVFEEAGHDPERVSPVSAEEYGSGKSLAARPRFSILAESAWR